jgi:hypothetical protein
MLSASAPGAVDKYSLNEWCWLAKSIHIDQINYNVKISDEWISIEHLYSLKKAEFHNYAYAIKYRDI